MYVILVQASLCIPSVGRPDAAPLCRQEWTRERGGHFAHPWCTVPVQDQGEPLLCISGVVCELLKAVIYLSALLALVSYGMPSTPILRRGLLPLLLIMGVVCEMVQGMLNIFTGILMDLGSDSMISILN